MRFKQFLLENTLKPGDLKLGDRIVVTVDFPAYNDRGEIPESWMTPGKLLEFRTEDKIRQLVFFVPIYEDGDNGKWWYADAVDFYSSVKRKRDADRDFINSLREAVNLNTLNPGDHVFVVKSMTGEATDNGHRTPFWMGDELEFMGFDDSGAVIATVYSEEEDETFEYTFDEAEFKASVVIPEEWKKLERERGKRFLKGLIDPDINEDFSNFRVGKKFKVSIPFSARETELSKAFHFHRGEDLEFAGTKPWKNGRIVYFFGKKDHFNTHYMFELPEKLFQRSVVSSEKFVNESKNNDPIEIGQTRIITGEGIIGVHYGELIPLSRGKITITDITPAGNGTYNIVTFTHEDHGKKEFMYMDEQIENYSSTPEVKRLNDKKFLQGLKEEEKFRAGDFVYFTSLIRGTDIDDSRLVIIQPGSGYYFYGVEDGYARLSPFWRMRQASIQIPEEDFMQYAVTKREYELNWMNSLVDKDVKESLLAELFDTHKKLKITKNDDYSLTAVGHVKHRKFTFMANQSDWRYNDWEVQFVDHDGSTAETGKYNEEPGRAIEVFNMTHKFIGLLIKHKKPRQIEFSADISEDESRAKIYAKMFTYNDNSVRGFPGYTLTWRDYLGERQFQLTRDKDE